MHLFGCSPSAIPKMIQCIDATQLAGSTSEGYTLPEQRHVRDGRTLGCTRAFSGIVPMPRVWHMSKSVTKMCDFRGEKVRSGFFVVTHKTENHKNHKLHI